MGEAKRRGTFAERREQALLRRVSLHTKVLNVTKRAGYTRPLRTAAEAAEMIRLAQVCRR